MILLFSKSYFSWARFGLSEVFESISQLLKMEAGLLVQKEAVHSLYLLLNCTVLSASCFLFLSMQRKQCAWNLFFYSVVSWSIIHILFCFKITCCLRDGNKLNTKVSILQISRQTIRHFQLEYSLWTIFWYKRGTPKHEPKNSISISFLWSFELFYPWTVRVLCWSSGFKARDRTMSLDSPRGIQCYFSIKAEPN